MGDVGLPALVRHLGLEPDEGAGGALLGLGGDEPPTGRIRQIVEAAGELPRALGGDVDRLGPRIEPLVGQALAERDDLILDPGGSSWGSPGVGERRLERLVAFPMEPTDELVDPLLDIP